MNTWGWLVLLSTTIAGCGGGGDAGADRAANADKLLSEGDVAAASEAYVTGYAEQPDSINLAVGASYAAYVAGDYAKADSILATVEPNAGELQGDIQLRRALVALKVGDLDLVRSLGENCGHPAGELLAAEVALADGEREAAMPLLASVGKYRGQLGDSALSYLTWLKDPDPLVQGLSEAEALWSLGQGAVASRSVEELLRSMGEGAETLMLLWAGRAASVGEVSTATALVDLIGFPPDGQAWRVDATRALIACAEGEAETCAEILDGVKGAPTAGLESARATAATLLAEHDAFKAREIVGNIESAAAARALMAADDRAAARVAAPSGPLADYLGGKSR